jgi:hypothetical protein
MTSERISIYGSGVFITIKTEDKYCSESCSYYTERPAHCVLFDKKLQRCLGGGPLRCAACLAFGKEVKP